MDIKLRGKKVNGKVKIPPSKSLAHRAVICASLCEGVSKISNISFSKDITASINGMRNLGASIFENSGSILVESGAKSRSQLPTIECNESGSTLRFLIPVALAVNSGAIFTGKGKLVERPLDIYYNLFDQMGIKWETTDGKLPLTVKGTLKSGEYKIDGSVSSQFVSGLLFALPLLTGDSKIIIENNLESKPYVDLTLDMLKLYGIKIQNNDYKEFIIEGNQKYKAVDYTVEGDHSQAAFFLVAGIINGNISVEGLKEGSAQGDSVIESIIREMGGNISWKDGCLSSVKSDTEGITIDASQCPDLVPILSVLGSLSNKTTKIINAARLRIKESDRLAAMTSELTKLGADIIETPDSLIIKGKGELNGGEVDSWNDHRIAMSLAVAALRSTSPVFIRNAGCVDKSYPNFWEDYKSIGGNIYE